MLLLQIIFATLLVGVISLSGVVLLARRKDLQKMTIFLISLASGSLLGGAFSHLLVIPDLAGFASLGVPARDVGGVRVLAARADVADPKALREVADQLKDIRMSMLE